MKKADRWLLLGRISIHINIVLGICKLLLGIYSRSIFLCVGSLYNAGIAFAKHIAVKGYYASHRPADAFSPKGYGRREYYSYLYIGIILMVSSLIFMVYSVRLCLFSSSAYYPMVVSIIIAAVTFTEIGLAIHGILSSRTEKSPSLSAMKLTSLASSLISLALTQTAILSFTQEEDLSFYNGIGDICMGGFALIIGGFMIINMYKIINGGYYARIEKRLVLISASRGIVFEKVGFEDYGPNSRILSIHVEEQGAGCIDAFIDDVQLRTDVEVVVSKT